MDAKSLEITFIVAGDPVAQPRPRFSARGGFARAYTPKRHPVTTYRQAIALAAKAAGARPNDDDVVLEVVAVFGRPKSHWLKGGLSPKAPARPPKNDWDNIGKAVSDALNGVAYVDDEQVIDGRVVRRYAARSEPARTVVTIRRV
jgi:Holliday junction resolvase RusA-like endonuclease